MSDTIQSLRAEWEREWSKLPTAGKRSRIDSIVERMFAALEKADQRNAEWALAFQRDELSPVELRRSRDAIKGLAFVYRNTLQDIVDGEECDAKRRARTALYVALDGPVQEDETKDRERRRLAPSPKHSVGTGSLTACPWCASMHDANSPCAPSCPSPETHPQ